MAYDPKEHHRRSIRLRGYDYARDGVYCITICTEAKTCLFGRVDENGMTLNEIGQLIDSWWRKLPDKFAKVRLDESIVMPNHLHGILSLGSRLPQGLPPEIPVSVGVSLSTVVRWFKTMTTNAYIQNVKKDGWRRFEHRLWQRNYYEHIVRDEYDLNRIRQYIIENPTKWKTDINFV